MDVAIRGDLASCLTLRLAPSTWVFAIARGFGEIDGVPIARAALARFESECRRRTRGEARRRRLQRSPVAASTLCGALARVNGALYLRGAGHDDYVPSACSFSAVLVVQNRAYVAHAGSTAAYLVHGSDVLALTAGDTFEEDKTAPVLARALGIGPTLTFSVSSIALEAGDTLALCGHALRETIDSRRFVESLESGPEEQVLRVRYEPSDDVPAAGEVAPGRFTRFFRALLSAARSHR
jgi:hypothetical protein